MYTHTHTHTHTQVRIVLDEDEGMFMIQDNGIGMSHDELRDNLGTIARSGSKQFLKEISQSGTPDTAKNIIGRFGVGFYSSFMVADEVSDLFVCMCVYVCLYLCVGCYSSFMVADEVSGLFVCMCVCVCMYVCMCIMYVCMFVYLFVYACMFFIHSC
jgi:hypothetical protein